MKCLSDLERLFVQLCLPYHEVQHPPLSTCLDADHLSLQRPGTRLKNLFLRDNYGRRHILLITAHNKAVDLKALSRQQQLSRLGFASAARLQRLLGVQPGHVSLLALINDVENEVEVWLDCDIWQGQALQCHPLLNTATWVIDKPVLLQFLAYTGHAPLVLTIPTKERGCLA